MYTITIEKQIDNQHPIAVITITGTDLNLVREKYRKEYDQTVKSAVITYNDNFYYRIM